MRDGWFYSEAGWTTGPVSIEALIAVLRQRDDPLLESLVWNNDCQFCGPAKDAPQVAEMLRSTSTRAKRSANEVQFC